MLHGRANGALGRSDLVAQGPELLGLALVHGDGGILHQPGFEGALQQGLGAVCQRCRTGGIGAQFDQHVPCVPAGQRSPRSGQVVQHGLQRMARHDFETFQQVSCQPFGMEQQGAGIAHMAKACPQHGAVGQRGQQAQGGPGDDAQGAFRADQQLLEVETAVVLLERHQCIENGTIGQDSLKAQNLRSHRSVAQHLRAAGIGRDQPADRGRTLAAQRERKAQAAGLDGLMQGLQDDASLAGRLTGIGINAGDPVHSSQRKDDGATALVRRRPSGHSRIAALRHDRNAMRGAQPDQRGNLCRRGWRGHAKRPPGIATAPIGQPGFNEIRVQRKAARAEQIDRRGGKGFGVGHVVIHEGAHASADPALQR